MVAECDIEADLARGKIFYAFMQLKDRRLSHPPGPATATHHITILAHSDTKTDVLITCASLPVSRELRPLPLIIAARRYTPMLNKRNILVCLKYANIPRSLTKTS